MVVVPPVEIDVLSEWCAASEQGGMVGDCCLSLSLSVRLLPILQTVESGSLVPGV